MSKPKIACCMITLDRGTITLNTLNHNRKTAGMDFDLFIYENGSTVEELNKLERVFIQAAFVNKSDKNDGVAHALNRLIYEAYNNNYDLIVIIGNDIENNPDWLAKLWQYSQDISQSGLIALNWGCGANPLSRQIISGLEADVCDGVFGVMAIPNAVIDTVGYFCEDYYPYGLEDSDYNVRVKNSGFINYYLPGIMSKHVDNDVGNTTPYRRMKDESLFKNLSKFNENMVKYDFHNYYYVGYSNSYAPPLNPAE